MVSPLGNPDSLDDERDVGPPSAQMLSLLSARRPSLAGTSDALSSFHHAPLPAVGHNDGEFIRPTTFGDASPRPDFSRGLQIKMQGWVGDGVGKMSISPSGRDVVLAARSGLYVIDLEAPLEVPRFLPQGGTWDVADVQWNPHPSRANYVVSTSSEKLLIWNLDRPDRSAIQFILSRHYRSITDLNWHNHNPDIVASTGIDSWIWMWDLRTSMRPVTGLCAFNPGATQVKWNRHNENILASSHGNILLIWDQRKGAVPLTTIKAHTARIYGIDWSRRDRDEIVTCSLDHSIKFWNTSASDAGTGDAIPRPRTDAPTHIPHKQIDTSYPVWRARYVPFGNGVLSLPQRGIQRPELFYEEDQKPIELVPESAGGEGKANIVKEYVWRSKGGTDLDFDDREFQLVTWSEDRTLRAWPIDPTILERAGFVRGSQVEDPSHRATPKYESYRAATAPPTTEHIVSAPGCRRILGGAHVGSFGASKQADASIPISTSMRTQAAGTGTGTFRRGGTMTKGTGKSKHQGMHALAWMPSVTVDERKEGSAPDSLTSSRISLDTAHKHEAQDKRSESPQIQPSNNSDAFDSEATSSWAEELTSVVNGLSSSKMAKVTLEKMELKKRMCTLGLQGPWGESSSVFIRVTFIFPREYPRSIAPQSLPHIDLEKNHLIPVKNRAFLLRELHALRRKPPCLEACLRFLLGLPNKRGIAGRSIDTDSGSSSEAEGGSTRPNRDASVAMRGQTGLAEPRTSQGVFGPNGELVCFSHMPLRMVRTMGRSISLSPSTASRAPRNTEQLNNTSGVLSDALRRLTAVAHDRQSTPPVATGADEDLLRTLESLAQPKVHHVSETPQSADVLDSAFLLRPMRKSMVSIRDVSEIAGLDKAIAHEYAVSAIDAGSFCQYNAEIARAFGRADHERVFKTLRSLWGDVGRPPKHGSQWHKSRLGRNIILSFMEELASKKDVLMLAMVSIVILISERADKVKYERFAPQASISNTLHDAPTPLPHHDDYLNLRRQSVKGRTRALSNASFVSQASLRSPTTPGPSTSLSSSASSKASWSSLLNASASSVRFLMSGQEGTSTPKAQNSPIERSKTLPLVADTPPRVEGFGAGPKTPENAERRHSPPFNSAQRHSGSLKLWSEPLAPPSHGSSRGTTSFVSAGHKDTTEVTNSWGHFPRKHLLVDIRTDFAEIDERREKHIDVVTLRLADHIIAYSEFLFRWGLLSKRLELLKCLSKNDADYVTCGEAKKEKLATVPLCSRCGCQVGPGADGFCKTCGPRQQKSSCSVCRLPATGLAHVCLVCCHITHLKCWKARKVQLCPTGCGCECVARGGFDVEARASRAESPVISPQIMSPMASG
ncbi:hypothetical protein K439DRAFT_1636189 [Ramaria rubella]|nr:hypothetical protein K439DRAFT_1636189 [Ramaria rubella]